MGKGKQNKNCMQERDMNKQMSMGWRESVSKRHSGKQEREREEKIKEKELRQGEGVFLSSCALSQRGQ